MVPHDGDTQEEIADEQLASAERRWALRSVFSIKIDLQNPAQKFDCRWRRAPSRERVKPEPRSPGNVAGQAEVAMLICMPSRVTARRLAAPSVSQAEPVVHLNHLEYAVGVLHAHYAGGAERSASL